MHSESNNVFGQSVQSNQVEYTEILVGIRKIIRGVNLENKQVEKKYGVSIPQLLCLNFLSKQNDYTATSSAIKKYLNLNASTVTGIVGRLEKKGLVARLPKSGDKRITRIVLTAKGNKLVNEIPLLMHDRLANRLQELPEDKLVEVLNAVGLLIDIMGADEVDASPMITIDEPI